MSTLRRLHIDSFNFVSTWDTRNTGVSGSSASNQIKLPLLSVGGIFDFIVYWGDGTSSHITVWNQAEATHTYATAGIYQITIIGKIRGFRFTNTGSDRLKILSIESFGQLELIDAGWFTGCANLNLTNVKDVPRNYSLLSNANAFINCTALTGINLFSSWLLPANDMTNFFRNTKFNQPISGVNTKSVSIWNSTFRDNLFFNQDISMLDFSSVTDMANFMTGKSAANYNASYYDSLLNTLDLTGKTGITLGMGTIKYTSAGATPRANLIAKSWVIADGGMV